MASAGSLVLSTQIIRAAPKQREVWIDASEAYETNYNSAPFDILMVALKKHPRTSRFKVQWTTIVGMSGLHTEAIYDRNHNVLWLEQNRT